MSEITNDERIRNLKDSIEKQLSEIPKEHKYFNTNLILTFREKQYNLHVLQIDALNELLINLYLYQLAANHLNINYSLCGYSITEWIDDINNLINNKQQCQRKEKLKSTLSKLDSLLSDTAKTQDFLDSVEAFLLD